MGSEKNSHPLTACGGGGGGGNTPETVTLGDITIKPQVAGVEHNTLLLKATAAGLPAGSYSLLMEYGIAVARVVSINDAVD